MNNYNIEGDSGEYEYLAEAVELSKEVDGICCEIGLRRGLGTKTIIDAVRQYCPDKTVISIDPFGSIPYVGREHAGKIRLDYDNTMRNQTIAAMYGIVGDVNWVPFIMTDRQFFKSFSDGVEINLLNSYMCNKYSVVHFDGPHTVEDVLNETLFFHDRSDRRACFIYDDITPNFYDHSVIDRWLLNNGYVLLKQGYKKCLYQKK